MKLKGISKLVLAGTALAATAATLTTATYAWYVTNASVDVLGASGSAASAETDGNLMVAQNKIVETKDTPNAYKVGLSSLDADSKSVPEGGITPQTRADTKWYKADGTEKAPTMLTYKFWLKATASDTSETNVTVTPVLTVRNATTNLASLKQTAYTGTAGVGQGETFVVDAVYALHMDVTTTTLKSGEYGTPTAVVTNGSVADIATDYAKAAGTADTAASDYDSNVYYFEIMGEAGKGTDASTGASVASTSGEKTWAAMNLESGVDTLITISFWLEGTDESCYDSCMSQAFEFDFNFTI